MSMSGQARVKIWLLAILVGFALLLPGMSRATPSLCKTAPLVCAGIGIDNGSCPCGSMSGNQACGVSICASAFMGALPTAFVVPVAFIGSRYPTLVALSVSGRTPQPDPYPPKL